MGKLSTTYLGLALGALFKSLSICDVVEERLHKRLALWKQQYLSKGGRLTLLKSILWKKKFFLFCNSRQR